MIDNQNGKKEKKNRRSSEEGDNHCTGCFYSYMDPAGGKRSLPASWISWSTLQYGLISVRMALNGNTHTLLFNLYDLHVTRRAQCPQWCLSEMAGVAPSQQGFIQQVLFGPLILSEM